MVDVRQFSRAESDIPVVIFIPISQGKRKYVQIDDVVMVFFAQGGNNRRTFAGVSIVIILTITRQACAQAVFAQNCSIAHPRRSQQFLVIRRPREQVATCATVRELDFSTYLSFAVRNRCALFP